MESLKYKMAIETLDEIAEIIEYVPKHYIEFSGDELCKRIRNLVEENKKLKEWLQEELQKNSRKKITLL